MESALLRTICRELLVTTIVPVRFGTGAPRFGEVAWIQRNYQGVTPMGTEVLPTERQIWLVLELSYLDTLMRFLAEINERVIAKMRLQQHKALRARGRHGRPCSGNDCGGLMKTRCAAGGADCFPRRRRNSGSRQTRS